MLIDLDRFKEITTRSATTTATCCWRSLVRGSPSGSVPRVSWPARGDEFAVLPALRIDDDAALEQLALDLLAGVEQPFMVDELSLEVGASVGIARFPRDGRRRPDAAAAGRYRDVRREGGAVRLPLLRGRERPPFTAAAERGWRVPPGSCGGRDPCPLPANRRPPEPAHARRRGLVRWQHPEHGLLAPGAFLHIVEQTGLIGPLTRHVLERSIAQCSGLETGRPRPDRGRQTCRLATCSTAACQARSSRCSPPIRCHPTRSSSRSPKA